MIRTVQTLSRFVSGVVVALALGTISACAQSLNLVYVESNIGSTANMNSVFGFSNDGNGNLTALPGSPYLTGGTGLYNPGGSFVDADQQVIIRPNGSQLLAVNSHSDTVAVFTINADGSLTPVSGSPFSSRGVEPASLGLDDGTFSNGGGSLTVINKNDDPAQTGVPSAVQFNLRTNGSMVAIPGGSISYTSTNSTAQALVVPKPRFVYVDQFMAGEIDAYRIQANGQLALINAVTAPGAPPVLGLARHPSRRIIYAGLPTINELAVFSASTTGALTFTTTVSDPGAAICWLVVNAAGTRLYAADNSSGDITVYDLTNPSSPVLLQDFPVIAAGGPEPSLTNIALDPTGNFLYVLDSTAVTLHVLNVSPTDGTVTEMATPVVLPEPSGEAALGVATLMK